MVEQKRQINQKEADNSIDKVELVEEKKYLKGALEVKVHGEIIQKI